MADLIALAKERRARLTAEIAKLDEFIQMGEMLTKYSTFKTAPKSSPEDGGDKDERPRASVVRPVP